MSATQHQTLNVCNQILRQGRIEACQRSMTCQPEAFLSLSEPSLLLGVVAQGWMFAHGCIAERDYFSVDS